MLKFVTHGGATVNREDLGNIDDSGDLKREVSVRSVRFENGSRKREPCPELWRKNGPRVDTGWGNREP